MTEKGEQNNGRRKKNIHRTKTIIKYKMSGRLELKEFLIQVEMCEKCV